jgi:hypothetical protein
MDMAKEVVAHEILEMDAVSLRGFITKHIIDDPSDEKAVVYVQDDEGRIFDHVSLVCETLSDGSKVFNLVLSES